MLCPRYSDTQTHRGDEEKAEVRDADSGDADIRVGASRGSKTPGNDKICEPELLEAIHCPIDTLYTTITTWSLSRQLFFTRP